MDGVPKPLSTGPWQVAQVIALLTYVPPCTLAVAVASCSTCHGSGGLPYPASHGGRPLTCAHCHGPVNNGAGTPSVGMSAALSGGTCVLGYPTNSGTHRDGTVNFGAAQ